MTTRAKQVTPIIIFEPLRDSIKMPEKKTSGAHCFDVFLPNTIRVPTVKEASTLIVPLGFKLEIPEGYAVKMHLRSSVGRDYPIMLSNTVGIIDEDFTGEVQAFVRNLGKHEVYFEEGARLFQIEIVKKEPIEIIQGEVTKETERSEQSGSTGK